MEKILVISTMYPSKAHTGFGIFVENQVKALKDRGFHVDVAAIKDPRINKPAVVVKYAFLIMRVLLIMLMKGRHYDIIHAHYVYPSGKLALLFKKLFRTTVIVTAHGGDLDKMAKKGPFFFRQTKHVLHQADFIIAVGEKLKQDMMGTFDVSEEIITVLNMGVDRQIFKPISQAHARKLVHLPSSATVILFVGNIIEAKGIDELISACHDLKGTTPSLELHLIGARKDPAFANQIREKMAREDIQNSHIHPPMKQRDVARWMAAADVFVIPSYMEGFGLVALEAMSCHTPVVGSDVGGLHYLLSGDCGILVKPKNRVSLRRGIERVLKETDLKQQLVANGEAKAETYDQEKLIGRLIAHYYRSYNL
ncbi:LPS biosynthesis protein RfbU [Lentibacillus kapialis]|uniref:LPS biosynthesis protein RfbU n=1 Tax=Lentibacillus kapialis TaxID=340214 RepID=A0A917UZR2_9BACI|nr:glycosyltransferase [Lentibacillus kapialis]GGK01687.1 LPS biosynthesis protein RfbU [Lentibacillus kapialis]